MSDFKMPILMLFVVIYSISVSNSTNVFKDDYSEYNENIYKKYVKMDVQLQKMAEKRVKQIIPYLLEAREHVNISGNCTKNLFDLITGFRKLTNWSFNFFDAMGKMQSGLLPGNLQMFGEYEECIEIAVPKKGKIDFRGQYCLAKCKPYLPKVKKIPSLNARLDGLVNATRNSSGLMKLFASKAQGFYAMDMRIGLCVPSGCSQKDMSEITNYTLGEYINCTINYCLKEGDIFYWTTKRIIIVSVFILLGAIVIISTWLDSTLDTWKDNKIGYTARILQCFSLTRNFPKLLNTDTPENAITCLNGIRVLTIFWVVLAHEFFLHAVTLTANHISMNFEKMLKDFFSQSAMNAFMGVDIFFFISGFLNCYSRILIKQAGRSQPSIWTILIHRLWRIYPAYIITFLMMYLLCKPQPFSLQETEEMVANCEMYWWQNILFINNFFHPFKMCLAQSWFLSVDMQLFLLSLFTIPVLLRKTKTGIFLHIGMILLVNLCSMSWWILDDIGPATLDSTRLDRNEMVKGYQIYVLPPVHLGPYFIGILLGYIIAEKKDIKIPKIPQLLGWLAASLFFISMLFMTLKWNSGIPYTKLESASYGAWSRTIMILGFSWLVFCCATGHSGLINYLLSLKLWTPLSRITYMIFLISPLIQVHHLSHLRFPDEFSDISIIWNYFGNLSISILMSIALVLIVESPMIAMEKVIFARKADENQCKVQNELTSNNIKENGFQENVKTVTIHL